MSVVLGFIMKIRRMALRKSCGSSSLWSSSPQNNAIFSVVLSSSSMEAGVVGVGFSVGSMGGCWVPGAREGVYAGSPCFTGAVDGCSMTVFAGGTSVVISDMAARVDGGGSRGSSTGGCGVPGAREGVYAGSPCFPGAVGGRFSTVCADSGATVVSDVARVVGLRGGSEGVSGAVGCSGVAPEGVSSFVWAVDGGFSSDRADSGATVVSDVARVVGLLGFSTGDWGVAGTREDGQGVAARWFWGVDGGFEAT